MKKKVVSMLLVSIMALTAASGCGGKTETPNNPSSNSTEGNVEKTETPDNSSENVSQETPAEETPSVDLGGYEFILASHWDADYEDEPGKSPLSDKFAEQFAEIEEKLNCKITVKAYPNPEIIADEVTKAIQSGDKPFDVLDIPYGVYMQLMASNVLYKLNTIPELQIGSDAYTPIVTNATTINGNTYGLWFGVTDNLPGLFVNYQVLEREGQPNPFDLYANGEWTWDKFREICIAVTKDVDGDGVPDQYGVGGNDILDSSILFSNNASYLVPQSDGTFQFGLTKPEAMDAVNFYRRLLHEDKVLDPEGDFTVSATKFVEGKLAFLSFFVWASQSYVGQNMEEEYGFIPFPTGPNATEHTTPLLDFRPFVMPLTLTDPDKSGIIFHEIASRMNEFRTEATLEKYVDRGMDENGIETFRYLLEHATPNYAGNLPGLGELVGILLNVNRDLAKEPASEFGAIESVITQTANDFYSKIK